MVPASMTFTGSVLGVPHDAIVFVSRPLRPAKVPRNTQCSFPAIVYSLKQGPECQGFATG